MSTTVVNPHVIVYPGTETVAELGIRIPVTSSNARWGISKSNEVRAKQGKVAWPVSNAHPEGARFWGWFEDLDSNGIARLDPASQQAFEANTNSFAMLKIVCRRKPGQYVAVADLRETKRLDDVEPFRPDGRALYSLPQHKLGVGLKRFFFVIHLVGTRDRADLRIDQVTLTRSAAGTFELTAANRLQRGGISVSAMAELVGTTDHVKDLKPRVEEAVRGFINGLSK